MVLAGVNVARLNFSVASLEEQIRSQAAAESITLASDYISTHLEDNADLMALINSWQAQKQVYESQLQLETELDESIAILEASQKEQKDRQDEILSILKKIHYLFFKRYGHYIQEGSWTSQDYVDDNLYYLDAVDVDAHNLNS